MEGLRYGRSDIGMEGAMERSMKGCRRDGGKDHHLERERGM